MTKEQENDYKSITNAWHLLKNYGDIAVGQDERWEILTHTAANMVMETPESYWLINTVMHKLQERCRRKAGLA